MADTSQTFYQCDACKIFFATIECFRNHACSCPKDQSVKQPQLEVERRTGIFCEVCFGVFYSVEDLQQHETECHHNDTPKSSASSSNDSAWTDQAHDDGSTDISGSTTGKSGSSGTEIVQAGTSVTWSRKATLLLISEYEKYTEKVEKGLIRKKAVWKAISDTLSRRGYRFSSEQVNGRWKTLLRGYKDVKDHNKKSGNSRKSYEYEEALDEIFEGSPTIQPKFTLSTLSKKTVAEETELNATDGLEDTLDENSASHSTDGEPKSKKSRTARKSNASELVDLVKTYMSSCEEKSTKEMQRKEELHKATMDMMQALTQSLKK